MYVWDNFVEYWFTDEVAREIYDSVLHDLVIVSASGQKFYLILGELEGLLCRKDRCVQWCQESLQTDFSKVRKQRKRYIAKLQWQSIVASLLAKTGV